MDDQKNPAPVVAKSSLLEQQLKAVNRALIATNKCSDSIIHGTSEQEIFQSVCQAIVKAAGYRLAWVGEALADNEKSVKPVAQAGYEEGYLETIKITWADNEFGRGPTGTSIRERKINVCQNMLTEERFRPWREEAVKRGYASSICLPMFINSDVFSLCIYAPEPDAFSEEEVQFLTQLAANLGFGINSLRTRKNLQKTMRALRAISACNQIIIHGKSEKEIIEEVCRAVVATGYSLAWVGYGKDDANKTVENQGFAGHEEKFLEKSITWADIPLGQRPIGIVMRTGNMFRSQNISADAFSPEWKTEALKRGYQSVLSLPMHVNSTRAGFTVFSSEPDAFTDEEVKLLTELANDLSYGITTLRVREEKQEAENKVKKEEKELNEAQRIGKVGSWSWDAVSNKIVWSEEYYRMIGLPVGSPTPSYEEHLKIYTPEGQRQLDAAVKKAMATGESYAMDLKQIRPDGTSGWIVARGEVIRDKDNKIIGLRGTAQDITERKLTEEKIKKMNVYNRNLIETSLDPMLTIDSLGKITDVNKAFETATGFEKQKLIGTDVSLYFTDPIKVKEGLERTFRDGFIKDYRVAIKNTLSGHILDCIWNTVVYRDEKGIVQGVFAAARDISQLERVQAALQASEERYKGYIENSSDIIYALDATGKFTYISPQSQQLGYAPEELIGKKRITDILPPESRNQAVEEFTKSQKGEKKKVQITFLYKDKSGHALWLEAVGTVLVSADGKFLGEIGIVRDITERKTSEDRLKELDTIKSRFIRVVSHQLRTPLSAIRWELESLLSEHDHLSELQKQLVQESYRANLEIINSINDLITALDIEEGVAVHLDKMPNSLYSLWESIAIEFANECKVKDITLETIKPIADIPLIDMDTERIRAVMQKLAENALMYSKEGGKITVKIESIDDTLRFIIADTGVGIPKDEQKNIFTRFYRASNASLMKPDASGLGLYIAKNFVQSHGGQIGFTSEEGKGSVFWFTIPKK